MTEHTPEEQALLQQGAEAKSLLTSNVFASTVNELSNNFAQNILTSDLKDQARRERLYMMHLALAEIVAILKSRVDVAEQIAMKQETGETETE